MAEKKGRIVHILKFGQALCRQEQLRGAPAGWPPYDYWVGEDKASEATCQLCIRESQKA